MTTILLLLAVLGATEEPTLNNSPNGAPDREEADEGACINSAAGDKTCKVVADEDEEEEEDDDEYDYGEDDDDLKEDDDIYDDDCKDKHPNCQYWADEDQCDENPGFMLSDCRRACRVCERQ